MYQDSGLGQSWSQSLKKIISLKSETKIKSERT